MDKSRLKIKIESKSSSVPINMSKGRTLCYIDLNKSSVSGAQSVMALSETNGNSVIACEKVLSIVRQMYKTNYFENESSFYQDAETFSLKIVNLFREINRQVSSMKNGPPASGVSLMLGLLCKNMLYIGKSGGGNVFLIRDDIIYSLYLEDDVFEPIHVNDVSPEGRIGFGAETYRLLLQEEDIVLFASDGITRMGDRDILLNFCLNDNTFQQNMENLVLQAKSKNLEKDVSVILLKTLPHELQSVQPAAPQGRILAELPPEYPPGVMPAEPDYAPYYGQQEMYEEEEEEEAAPRRELSFTAKLLLLVFAIFLTVSGGLFWFSYSGAFTPPYNSRWEILTEIPVRQVLWQKKVADLNGNLVEFRLPSNEVGELVVRPGTDFYDCTIEIDSATPMTLVSEPVFSSVETNKIEISKGKVSAAVNLFTQVETAMAGEAQEDSKGRSYYTSSYRFLKVKGNFSVTSFGAKEIRDIKITVTAIPK